MTKGPIRKIDWFKAGLKSFNGSLALLRSDRLPPAIEAFMIETPILHMLRGIHGKGNIGVAVALLRHAIGEWLTMKRVATRVSMERFWYCHILRMSEKRARSVIFDSDYPEFEDQVVRDLHGADGP